MNCPLCKKPGEIFYKDVFYICKSCFGIYKNRDKYMPVQEEKRRYEEHNNDIYDRRYQNFVSPITDYVLNTFNEIHEGLDYGAGTGPVISKILRDKGYKISIYDPFFANYPKVLNKNYDYIICCEVIEHFHNPNIEFGRLRKLLNPGGKLICMTYLYNSNIDFKNWFYKRDPSHVFIYQKETIDYIAKNFYFSNYKIDKRLIVFESLL